MSASLAAGTCTADPAAILASSLDGDGAEDAELAGWVLSRYLLGAATDLQNAIAAGATPRPVSQVLAGVDLVLNGFAG